MKIRRVVCPHSCLYVRVISAQSVKSPGPLQTLGVVAMIRCAPAASGDVVAVTVAAAAAAAVDSLSSNTAYTRARPLI